MDDATKDILKELEEYQKTGYYKKPEQDKKPEKKAKEVKKEKKMEDAPERKEVVIRLRMPGMPSPRTIERIIYTLVILALLYFAFIKPINKECLSMPGFSFLKFFDKSANTTAEVTLEEVEEEKAVANKTVNETKKIEPVRQSIANLNSTSNLTASDFDFAVGDFIIDKKTNETVKIKDIKFTIRNKGASSFTGFVEAYMYDESTKEDMEDYKRGEKLVAANAGSSATYSVAISPSIFSNLDEEKTIVLLLKDSKHELIKKATKKISFV